MSEVTKCFADRLSDLIEESGKHFRDLAKEIGISTGSLSKYQNDAAVAGIDALVKISAYFDVSTDWLLGVSDIESKDIDIKEINKKTGLSEAAIIALQKGNDAEVSNDFILLLIDHLLEGSPFILYQSAARLAASYLAQSEIGATKYSVEKRYVDSVMSMAKVTDVLSGEKEIKSTVEIPAGAAGNFYADRAVRMIDEIVRQTIDEYKERMKQIIECSRSVETSANDIEMRELWKKIAVLASYSAAKDCFIKTDETPE